MRLFLARAEAEAKRAKEATERANNAEAELLKLRILLKEKGINL